MGEHKPKRGGRLIMNNVECLCAVITVLYIRQKWYSSYSIATCWEKCVPLAGKKCVGLECHIKPLKLVLLSKLSQTQNKSNCVIYLIADENLVLFLWIQVACIPKRKHPFFFFFQISFLSIRSWPCYVKHIRRPGLPYFWGFYFSLCHQALRERTDFLMQCFFPLESSLKCFRLGM